MEAIFAFSFLALLLSFGALLHAIFQLMNTNNTQWTVHIVFWTILFVGTFASTIISSEIMKEPTNDDVVKEKAVYQEDLHIRGNDTIRTYTIVWKK